MRAIKAGFLPLWLVFAVALVICCQQARADNRVLVKAKADADYAERKFAGDKPKQETYLFYQGRYYEGAIVDHSIERTTFRQIAQTLGGALTKQNYFPSRDPKSADLLIIVHWGTTIPADSMYKLLAQNNPQSTGSKDTAVNHELALANIFAPGNLISEQVAFELQAESDFSPPPAEIQRQFDALDQRTDRMALNIGMTDTAHLLGFADELYEDRKRIWSSAKGITLRACLTEERHFIILKAFDYRLLLKEQKWRQLWTVSLSMRSPGTNFTKDLPWMSQVASNYFGTQLDELKIVLPKVREGKVEIGTPIILGEAILLK